MNDIYVLPLILSLLVYKGSALLCNVCESRNSWKDCDDNRSIVNCSSVDPEFDVCFKVHRAFKSNNSESHVYTKGCGYHEQCNGDECREYGHWCKVDCCNLDKCNASQTVQATYMTYFLLAVFTAVHFL